MAVAPRLWPDSTVVLIGGGPSLTAEDVAACRDRARVIAINDAHRIAPWADVLYSSDQRWWEFYRGVPEWSKAKYGIAPLRPQPDWGITVLRNTGDDGIDLDPSALRTGRNSGYAAMNLAIHFGARRLVLLGYDMQAPGGPARSHWFGAHPSRLQADSPYQTFLDKFTRVAPLLRELGIEVINASRETALTVFPRAPIEEALA